MHRMGTRSKKINGEDFDFTLALRSFKVLKQTLSAFVFSSLTMVQYLPSSLYAILNAERNCTFPKSLAPCVIIPVMRFGLSKSTCYT